MQMRTSSRTTKAQTQAAVEVLEQDHRGLVEHLEQLVHRLAVAAHPIPVPLVVPWAVLLAAQEFHCRCSSAVQAVQVVVAAWVPQVEKVAEQRSITGVL